MMYLKRNSDVYYDDSLNVEVYKFYNIKNNLPKYWHDLYLHHFVIGYIMKKNEKKLLQQVALFKILLYKMAVFFIN